MYAYIKKVEVKLTESWFSSIWGGGLKEAGARTERFRRNVAAALKTDTVFNIKACNPVLLVSQNNDPDK